MKKLHFILGFISMFFLSSCEKDAYDVGRDAIFSYSKQLEKTYHLTLYGWGGSFDEKIKQLNVSYWSVGKLKLKQARVLFISAAKSFLDQVNEDKKIQEFLDHPPFDVIDLRLEIHFEPREEMDNTDVAHIFMTQGKILYSYVDKTIGKLEPLYTETYSEALKIVQEESPQN